VAEPSKLHPGKPEAALPRVGLGAARTAEVVLSSQFAALIPLRTRVALAPRAAALPRAEVAPQAEVAAEPRQSEGAAEPRQSEGAAQGTSSAHAPAAGSS